MKISASVLSWTVGPITITPLWVSRSDDVLGRSRGGREHPRIRRRVMRSGVVPSTLVMEPRLVASCSSTHRSAAVVLVIGRPRSRAPGGCQGPAENIGRPEIGVPPGGHHGVKIGVVEAGASGSGVSGRLERVNLGIGEIGGAWSIGRQPLRMRPSGVNIGPGSVGFSDGDMELAVLFDFSFGLQRLSSVQGHDVGVHVDGHD